MRSFFALAWHIFSAPPGPPVSLNHGHLIQLLYFPVTLDRSLCTIMIRRQIGLLGQYSIPLRPLFHTNVRVYRFVRYANTVSQLPGIFVILQHSLFVILAPLPSCVLFFLRVFLFGPCDPRPRLDTPTLHTALIGQTGQTGQSTKHHATIINMRSGNTK